MLKIHLFEFCYFKLEIEIEPSMTNFLINGSGNVFFNELLK